MKIDTCALRYFCHREYLHEYYLLKPYIPDVILADAISLSLILKYLKLLIYIYIYLFINNFKYFRML